MSDHAQERTIRRTLRSGALLGAMGTAAGAFGAHALRGSLEPRLLEVFETGARYQLIHAVALLVLAALMTQRPGRAMTWAARLMTVGTIVEINNYIISVYYNVNFITTLILSISFP